MQHSRLVALAGALSLLGVCAGSAVAQAPAQGNAGLPVVQIPSVSPPPPAVVPVQETAAPASGKARMKPLARAAAPTPAAAQPAPQPLTTGSVAQAAAAPSAQLAGKPAGKPSGRCTRLAFEVNDYGKEGPARDAKALLDTHIAKWAGEKGIKKYTVGKKTVNCRLFLDFGFFDEHTCRAEAPVCW